jgi:hypothetical protein
MGIGRLFQCLLANFVRLRQVLILALDFSSAPLTNFEGAFHKIPCGHSLLRQSEKVVSSQAKRSRSNSSRRQIDITSLVTAEEDDATAEANK